MDVCPVKLKITESEFIFFKKMKNMKLCIVVFELLPSIVEKIHFILTHRPRSSRLIYSKVNVR